MKGYFIIHRMGGVQNLISFSSLGADHSAWAGLVAYGWTPALGVEYCDDPAKAVEFIHTHTAPMWELRYRNEYRDEFPVSLDKEDYPIDDDSDEDRYPFYDTIED